MINNISELLWEFNHNTISDLKSVEHINFTHIQVGVIVGEKHYFDLGQPIDPGAVTGVVLTTQNSKPPTSCFTFPFDLNQLHERALMLHVKETLIARYGKCHESTLAVIEHYLSWDAFYDALLGEESFECPPESTEVCHWQPQYDDGIWTNFYFTQSVKIDKDGLWGVLHSYDGCDWDEEHLDLLNEDGVHWFLKAQQESISQTEHQEYLEWVIEHKTDPLQQFFITKSGEDYENKLVEIATSSLKEIKS